MGKLMDKVGVWTESKHEILRKYCAAYTTIMNAQQRFHWWYIDAFAGCGEQWSKEKDCKVPGSPLVALSIEPKFERYIFIDLEHNKTEHLKGLVPDRDDVEVLEQDGNSALRTIIPRVDYSKYMRALCVLDPYGLHLDWSVVEQCGHAGSIELFLNFPIHDINRNVHRQDTTRIRASDRGRLNAFWGDSSWQDVMYSSEENLFGLQDSVGGNNEIVAAYKKRLETVAGFEHVPEPVAMYNKKNADLYYLFFASHNRAAGKIVSDIFRTYTGLGVRYGSRIKH